MMGISFILSFLVAFIISYAAKFMEPGPRQAMYLLSGIILTASAVYNYYRGVKKSGSAVDLLALFSLSYTGGMGVSCLKLSALQTDWEPMTWVCLFLAYMGFYMAYTRSGAVSFRHKRSTRRGGFMPKRVFVSMVCLTAISAAAFVTEAILLGYIPLFTVDVPHAYSYFHISGLHYFTVSCVLVPSLAFIYTFELRKARGYIGIRDMAFSVVCTALALFIPILCVSRFQLLFAVLLLFITALTAVRPALKKTARAAAGLFILMLPLYVFLTVERAHSVEYLNGIFEMKYEELPIFISQPYIYIANNYDNFNCLVRDLSEHSYGLRMLFPLWAFTGLKFLAPALVSFPIYVTKTELTTLTLFYDAYYDFGVLGVALFSALTGFLCRRAAGLSGDKNPVGYLIYAQLAAYMGLSFFTTWFSNPTTWFYLAVSVIIYLYTGGYFEKLPEMRA